ncbi:hypothetical protein FB451DRAFT_1273436 [Mycena latifolia]|nr:hypothetical protein FB451DRAFT_1273436 [Mycena latifolia]
MDPILTSLIQGNEPLNDAQTLHVRHVLDDTLTAISDLEEEISKTLLSLLKLENERRRRSKYAGTLKGALSPLRRIPPEILAEIFRLCRNSSLYDAYYFIADPRQAPMLLGHVSSRWRHVCHGSPRLWDHFHSRTSTILRNPTIRMLQPILARSRTLPLHVKLDSETAGFAALSDLTDLFDLVWREHRRLKQFSFNIHAVNFPPHAFDPQLLPILSSLDIRIRPNIEVAGVVALFYHAPQLRDVSLRAYHVPPGALKSALPWSQFTRLKLDIPISLGEARDILTQGDRLEECRLTDLIGSDDPWPSQNALQLNPLQRLTIHTTGGPIPDTFFAAFSFPNLIHLDISSSSLSPETLPNLYDRSKFRLTHLALEDVELSTEELIVFLRLLAALQTLNLSYCGVEDALFKAFTYNPNEPTPTLSLPRLTSLTVTEGTERLNGVCVAHMVESVCAHAGGQNAAFPALMVVHLWVDGPKFEDDIEDRIAAASAIGLVVDHATRYRNRDEEL